MGKHKIEIYTPVNSERLFYVCHIVFKIILNIDYRIVNEKDSGSLSLEGTVINYSDKKLNNSTQIIPFGLLSETGIRKQQLSVGKYEGLPVLFFTGKGDLPYDFFSAIFYLVTRYEEYLDFTPDQYGRFKAEDSIAYKLGFVHLPIVEMWTLNLARKIGLKYNGTGYKQLLTIDVDNAWMFKNKGLLRGYGGVLLSMFKGRLIEAKDKLAVITGRKKDPADTYKYIDDIGKNLSHPVQFFILVGRNKKHDNALSVAHPGYSKLLWQLYQKNKLGFHPSYESTQDFNILSKEYYKLCSIFTRRIVKSRQHYLKITFPETFRNLIKLAVREEYSLGWSSQVGFRAGISVPFPFFDLIQNEQAHLILTPFMVMDRTLKDYLKFSPEQAIVEVNKISDSVKKVNGQFTVLWHNDSLSDYGEWKGWKKVFEETIKYGEKY